MDLCFEHRWIHFSSFLSSVIICRDGHAPGVLMWLRFRILVQVRKKPHEQVILWGY